jgi:hypothetical protein
VALGAGSLGQMASTCMGTIIDFDIADSGLATNGGQDLRRSRKLDTAASGEVIHEAVPFTDPTRSRLCEQRINMNKSAIKGAFCSSVADCCTQDPMAATRSRLTPDSLSGAYFSILWAGIRAVTSIIYR